MRRFYILVLLIVLAAGFFAPGVPATAQDGNEEANEARFRQLVEEVYHQGNVEVLDVAFAPDFVNHTAQGDESDIESVKAGVTAFRAAMPDLHAVPEIVLAEGDWLAVRYHIYGTFENDLTLEGEGGPTTIPATGAPYHTVIHAIYRFNEEGQIAEEWQEADTLSTLIQFGILPMAEGVAGEPMAEAAEVTINETGMEEAHKEAFNRIVEEVFNQGSVDLLNELLAPDYVSYAPDGTASGLEETVQSIAVERAAIPDMNVTVDAQVAEGDWLASRVTLTGTFEGEFALPDGTSIPPTGEPINSTVILFQRFNEEGLIVEEYVLYDQLVLLEQLGVLDEMLAGMQAGAEESTGEGAGEAGAEEVVVDLQNFAFNPKELTIPAGTTVRFINGDQAPHTATADDGSFSSRQLDPGGEFTFTFSTPGTFPYYCQFHGAAGGAGMSGTIIVQ